MALATLPSENTGAHGSIAQHGHFLQCVHQLSQTPLRVDSENRKVAGVWYTTRSSSVRLCIFIENFLHQQW